MTRSRSWTMVREFCSWISRKTITKIKNVSCERQTQLTFEPGQTQHHLFMMTEFCFTTRFRSAPLTENQSSFICSPPHDLISSLMASCAFVGTGELIFFVCVCVCLYAALLDSRLVCVNTCSIMCRTFLC